MKKLLVAAALCLVASVASGAELSRVNVSAPDVNCVFDPDCTIAVTDTSDTIVLPGGAGSGFLQSRTFVGQEGSPAEGLYGYEYRIDLTEIEGILAVPCVVTFAIDFGPTVPLDYDGDGDTEHVYIITGGGLGSVGPDFASRTGNRISFHFYGGVCAGESSFFFGMASRQPPRSVTAQITETLTSSVLDLAARAPLIPPCPPRPDLNADLTAAERDVLDDLVLGFIDECVIGQHYTPGIHSTGMLLPWHRDYVGQLENDLILAGHPEFVPFPKWDASNPIPAEFQDIDPSCPSANEAVCPTTAPAEGGSGCAALADTTPGVAFPAHLQLPQLCDYETRDELTSGGVVAARPGLNGYHGSVHCAVGGSMCTFHSPSANIFWGWHSFIDDIWAAWECNCNFLIPVFIDPFPEDLLTPCRIVPCWISWWPLEDPHIFDPFDLQPRLFQDIRGVANAAIPQGDPMPVPGRVGSALSFDGMDDFLQVPDDPELGLGTTDFAIDAWVMMKAPGMQPIVEKRDASGLGFSFFLQDGLPGIEFASPSPIVITQGLPALDLTRAVAPAGSMAVTDGEWHHVAVTVDRDQAQGGRLFVDGTAVLSFDPRKSPGDLGNTADLLIARSMPTERDPKGAHFSGAIDELDIFRRGLKPDEIAGIFRAGEAGKLGALTGVTPLQFREICSERAFGEPGRQVTVPLTLSNGDGVAGLQVDVGYNPAILMPVDVRLGADTAAAGGWMVSAASVGPGVLRVLAHSSPPTGLGPTFKEVALVDFDVAPGAPIGTSPLSQSNCVLSDAEGLSIPCALCAQPGGVVVRNASAFMFQPIPSPVGLDGFDPLPFPVTVEALDSLGNRALGYNSVAGMSIVGADLCSGTLQPSTLPFAAGLGGPQNFAIHCCVDPLLPATRLPLRLEASDPPIEVSGQSNDILGVAKADVDASGDATVLDVTRTVRLALLQGTPAPPPAAFQAWAANMLDDHCLVDSSINVLDVVRVKNRALGKPPLCSCGGPFDIPAATAVVQPLSVSLVREGPASFLLVVKGARELGGLQIELRNTGANATVELESLVAGRSWQLWSERQKGSEMRIVAFASGATGVSGDGAVLRITGAGNPRLLSVTAADSEGRQIPVR